MQEIYIMKTILAATDFSAASHNAVVYAASLARVFDSHLVLYNAYRQVLSPAIEPVEIFTLEKTRQQAEQQLRHEAAAIDPYSQLVVETLCNENDPARGIAEAAINCKANMIVTGMKGSGKGIRKVIGSTATALIRKATVPVIVVPEKASSGRLDTIALATESDLSPESDPHMLDILREIGERFSSKLYLVRIAKNKFEEAFEILNRPFRINKMVGSLHPVFECIKGTHVAKALNDFVKEYRVDMVALLPHKHSFAARLLAGSTSRSMMFETKVPLLILPDLPREAKGGSRLKKESSL